MLLTVAGEPLIAYLLASVRITAWLMLVPPFSSRAVPATAKVVLALGLAFSATPMLGETTVPTGTVELAVSTLTQVLVGAAMGFVTYVIFAAISAAGAMIDIFGGFALAQGFDPLSMNMNTVFGKFHQSLATVLLFVTGAHMLVIGGLLRTFDLMPVGAAADFAGFPDVLMGAFGVFFITAVQIALPLIAVLFIADIALALLTKVAPQLNALNVMFPAKIGLTLMLIGLALPALPEVVMRLTELVNEAVATLAGAGG